MAWATVEMQITPNPERPGNSKDWLLWIRGAKLQQFTGATEVTRTSSTQLRNWKLHTLNARFATVFVFHFFGVNLEHFLCFPTWAVPFCRPPHYVFMRLPCLLLLHLLCIRRDLVSTQLSGREGEAYWRMKEIKNNMYFQKREWKIS